MGSVLWNITCEGDLNDTLSAGTEEMTIDERLAFLLQSTESLHASVQELHATAAEHTKQLQIDAENIRRLANIAAAHESRLDDLEGRQ